MRRFILAAAMFMVASHGDAGTVATSTNDAGGMMVLSDVKCSGERDLFVAYTVVPNSSKTLMGCWTMDDNFVFIRWNDGDVRTYPFGIWDIKTKKKGNAL